MVVRIPFIKDGGTLSSPSIEMDPTGTAITGSIAVAIVGLSLIGKSLWERFFSSRDPRRESMKQIENVEVKEQRDRN
jgi:plastocyanin domain-containing protein